MNQNEGTEESPAPVMAEVNEMNEATAEVNPASRFQELLDELSAVDKKRAAIHHKEECGNEEVFYGEGLIGGTEFVCHCDHDQRWGEAKREFEPLLQKTSDFAHEQKIYNQAALGIHQRAGDLARAYTVAQTLGLVQPQLDLLWNLKRFEEGAELAMKNSNHDYAFRFLGQLKDLPRWLTYAREKELHKDVLETLLRTDDVEEALRYAESKARYAKSLAESKAMHTESLRILCSKQRTDEAISYAEKYALHEESLRILRSNQRTDEAISYAEKYNLHHQALEMLKTQGRLGAWFEYGARHDCRDMVRLESKKVLEDILNEDRALKENPIQAAVSKAGELCAALETYQQQRSAALYNEVVSEFERRIKAKELISEHEENIKLRKVLDTVWFEIADLELSLGNSTRYIKIWKKTKEIWESRSYSPASYPQDIEKFETEKGSQVSLAQSMIDNPRYYSSPEILPKELPKWKYSSQQLLRIAVPLAELLESENEAGEKKYPHISLEKVINAWGTRGMNTYLSLDNFLGLQGSRDYAGSSRGVLASELMKTLAVSLTTVTSPEAFIFIVYHYPCLLETNCSKSSPISPTSFISPQGNLTGESEAIGKSEVQKFNHIGRLLEVLLKETASDKEGSVRRRIALGNILYVPVKQLTKENIFAAATGGSEVVWKYAMSYAASKEAPSNEKFAPGEESSPLIDERLRKVQENYPQFDEDTRKKMKQVFFEAHRSPEGIPALERALTLYTELRKAYGAPKVFPAGHPLHFLRDLPPEEAKFSHAALVMEELFSIPQRKSEVAEAALGKPLHEFFRVVLASYNSFTREKKEIASRLGQLFFASEAQLGQYLCAWQFIQGGDDTLRFWKLQAESAEETLEHYDLFSQAILSQRSSLAVEGPLATHLIETQRTVGPRRGIRDSMLREFDGIRYLFKEMYSHSQTQQFKDDSSFRQLLVAKVIEFWKKKQGRVVPAEVMETLAQVNFHKFFNSDNQALQKYLQTQPLKKGSLEHLFEDQPDLLLPRLLDPDYYDVHLRHARFSDEFINAMNRLKNGLSTSWSFDEVKFEFNANPLNNFFNNAGECTGNGGKYQRYGYGHLQDRHIGIIAANLYEAGKYKNTVGKGFLARCRDRADQELLYVDGIVMLQDIADFLAEPHQEAHWMPLFTKALIQTAVGNNLEEMVINASHKLAQRTVWQYLGHIATLLGLQEGRDFKYEKGKVDDGSSPQEKINLKTISGEGFELSERVVGDNCYYLEKIPDGGYHGQHLLEGFWLNHWDPRKAAPEERKNSSKVYTGVWTPLAHLAHSDTPQINDGKGYVVGFRVPVLTMIKLYNQKYGGRYGVVE